MKKSFFLSFTILAIVLLKACDVSSKQICTSEYRYVTIEVEDQILDDFFTIRVNSGDTIRHNNDHTFGEGVYIVLSDSYRENFKGNIETFVFYGVIKDSVVIKEDFLISSDACHIQYISGNQKITL